VSGATDVVWTALPVAQLKALAVAQYGDGHSVLEALLTVLGMPATMARSECALLSKEGALAEMSVSDGGVLSLPDGGSMEYGVQSLLAYKKEGTSDPSPWLTVEPNGGSMLVWPDGKCVFGVLAAMAKKAMDRLCGLALVGVGEGGGVMSWMVQLHTQYSEISYANIVKAYAALSAMQWCFKEGKTCYLKTDGNSWIDTGFVAQGGMLAEIVLYYRSGRYDAGSHNTPTNGGTNNNYNRNQMMIEDTDFTWNVLGMGSNNKIKGLIAYNSKHKIEMCSSFVLSSNPYYIVDGTRYNVSGVIGILEPVTPVILFKEWWSSALTANGNSASYYSIKDKEGTLKRFLVPSKYNGKYCMFDLVSGTFFENQGTGSFSIEVIDD